MTKIQQAKQSAKKRPKTGNISVDSLKIRIPIGQVKILDESLTAKWILVSEHGEIDPDYFKENSFTKYIDEAQTVKIRFGIERQRTERQVVDEFLTILLPSKILGNRYFEGITLDNVENIYIKLMNTKVVSFSLNTFLFESGCTDVDFKKDFECPSIDKLISKLSANCLPSKNRGDGIRPFRQVDNKGLEFNERKTSRYKTRPFLKLYDKEIELTTAKRQAFAKEYLSDIDFTGISRIESTVKNKAHFRHLGIQDTTLNAILSLSDEQKEMILSNAVQCNLEPRIASIRTPSVLTPNKQMIHNSIILLLNEGMPYQTIKMQLLTGIKDKSVRSRKGKEMDEIYNVHIRGKKVDVDAEELNRIYDLIGWR